MKKFKELVNEIYEPNTPDEAKFINMHTIKTFDYPVKNDHGLPFRDDRIKAAGPQHKKSATYDPPKEPAAVYTKANEEVVDEKTLTPAEKRKREEVAKAIERDNPKMPMPMKMAIATKTAKRVAEDTAELRLLLGLNPSAQSSDQVFETNDILSLLKVVSDNDSVAEIFLEDDNSASEGLIIDKEIADVILRAYEDLDEESQENFEFALTDGNSGFDHCVDFAMKFIEEELHEEKHVFHVHVPADDIRGHKMVDDRTSEPVGDKPKGHRLKITVPGSSRTEATNKAAKYVAKNYGTHVKFTYAGKASEET
jgi:hypothetical protein